MDASGDEELKKLIHADFSGASNEAVDPTMGAKAEPPTSGGKKKPKKATGKATGKANDKPAPAQVFLCEKCEKTYKTKSGLIKHKLTCMK